MNRLISLIVLIASICASVACYAEETKSFNYDGVSIEVPADWTHEMQMDGTEIFYDMASGRVLTIYTEKADGLLFQDGFEMAVPYVESIFVGDNLWSRAGLIKKDEINGCYAAGYIEDMPAGIAYLESENYKTMFVLADVTCETNPNSILDDLLGFLPWMDDTGAVDLHEKETIDFTMGGYEYKVPASWRHSESIDYNERTHTCNNGDIILSILWNNNSEARLTSAVDMLYKSFPNSMIEIIYDGRNGFLMDGEFITGAKMIKACLIAKPGYVEITYIHHGSDAETQRKEFDDWFETLTEIE